MAIGVLVSSSGIAAQQPVPGRGLFGASPETSRPVSMINLSVSGGSGDGGNSTEAEAIAGAGRFYTGVHATASYANQKTRPMREEDGGELIVRAFSGSVATAIRYVPTTREYIFVDRSVRLGFESQLGRRSRFTASQSAQLTPFYQFGPTLGILDTDIHVPPANVDGSATVGGAFYDFGTALGLTHGLSRRASLVLAYNSRVNLYSSSSGDLMSHRAGVGFRYSLGRHATFVLGTGYRYGRWRRDGLAQPTTAQDFDLGIDYNRSLSFARNTTLSFTTGTTMASQSGTTLDGEAGRRLRVTGTLGVARPFGRDWLLRGAYQRNLQFVAGYPDPFFVTGVMGRLTGQIGRRMSLVTQLDRSRGDAIQSAAGISGKHVEELRGQARFNVALSGHWQIFVEHDYSRNQVSAEAQASLPDGLVPRLRGQALRFGLNLWASHIH